MGPFLLIKATGYLNGKTTLPTSTSFNKNGKVLDLVDYECLVPKGAIVTCKGKEVVFADGTKHEFDLVILSTGYSVDYPYLPKRYGDV